MLYILKELQKDQVESVCADFSALLKEMDITNEYHSLRYVLRELIYNAIKANIKRIFIAENKSMDAGELIEAFHSTLYDNSDTLMKKLNKSNLTVKIEFKKEVDKLIAEVHNKTEMLSEEKEYVDNILNNQKTEDLTKVKIREGAGLGLRSALRILTQTGFCKGTLSYQSKNGETIFKLELHKLAK